MVTRQGGAASSEAAFVASPATPNRSRPGFAVLFTGLSGAGKTTIARAVEDAMLAGGERTVSLLDGDVVRAELSAELGFSRADRERSVARIGFVAEHVVRHGGVALCAVIAPYAGMRTALARRVRAVGGFLLVHVATPLTVCEARDVKGLYARARTGELAAFTGVSDPYETPADADLVLDTRDVPVAAAVQTVLDALVDRGWWERVR